MNFFKSQIDYIQQDLKYENYFINAFIVSLWNFISPAMPAEVVGIPKNSAKGELLSGSQNFVILIKFVDKVIQDLRIKSFSWDEIEIIESVALRMHSMTTLTFSFYRSKFPFNDNFIWAFLDSAVTCREMLEKLLENNTIPISINQTNKVSKEAITESNDFQTSSTASSTKTYENGNAEDAKISKKDISTTNKKQVNNNMMVRNIKPEEILKAFDFFFNKALLKNCFNDKNKQRIKSFMQKLAWFANDRIEHLIRIELDVTRGEKSEKMSFFYPRSHNKRAKTPPNIPRGNEIPQPITNKDERSEGLSQHVIANSKIPIKK